MPRTLPVRVFLCDDVKPFRDLLRHALEEDPGLFIVVGEAADGFSGIEGVEQTRPDVVLLDMAMPHLDGLQALPRMRRAAPEAHVIALSGFSSDRMAGAVLAQGGSAYLEKGAPLSTITSTVLAHASERAVKVSCRRPVDDPWA